MQTERGVKCAVGKILRVEKRVDMAVGIGTFGGGRGCGRGRRCCGLCAQDLRGRWGLRDSQGEERGVWETSEWEDEIDRQEDNGREEAGGHRERQRDFDGSHGWAGRWMTKWMDGEKSG